MDVRLVKQKDTEQAKVSPNKNTPSRYTWDMDFRGNKVFEIIGCPISVELLQDYLVSCNHEGASQSLVDM